MRHSSTLAVAFAAALGSSALADVITQWNFEAQTFNASTGTGLASLVGGTTSTFATGFGGTGTFALNTSTYAVQGTGDRTRGVQFSGSTAGYDSITLTWNERHSNTSANTVAVFASVDGTNWTEVQVFTFTPAASGTGDTWYQRSVSLSAAYANAANFGFRVLAAFNPGTSGYLASRSTSVYGTASTLRFDDVTISGNVVPAPGAAALVGLAGLISRRRRA
jgi:MYXO-CTERM domain-containing protein